MEVARGTVRLDGAANGQTRASGSLPLVVAAPRPGDGLCRLARRTDGPANAGGRTDLRCAGRVRDRGAAGGAVDLRDGVPDRADGGRPGARAGVHAALPSGAPAVIGPPAEVPGGRAVAEPHRPQAAGRVDHAHTRN